MFDLWQMNITSGMVRIVASGSAHAKLRKTHHTQVLVEVRKSVFMLMKKFSSSISNV